MAYLIELKTIADQRGSLTVLENLDQELPFPVKRIFYIYRVDDSVRGGHRHHQTVQAAICLQGACTIWNSNGEMESVFRLDNPHLCLVLEPRDWHKMYDFTPDAILLVFASEPYDPADYIFEPYPALS